MSFFKKKPLVPFRVGSGQTNKNVKLMYKKIASTHGFESFLLVGVVSKRNVPVSVQPSIDEP